MRYSHLYLFAALHLCAVMTAAPTAKAGSASAGTIAQLYVVNGGTHVVIILSATLSSKDACATSPLNAMAFSATTNEGKAMLSVITAAYLAGKTVNVFGTTGNACTTAVYQFPNQSHVIETLGQIHMPVQ